MVAAESKHLALRCPGTDSMCRRGKQEALDAGVWNSGARQLDKRGGIHRKPQEGSPKLQRQGSSRPTHA